MAILWLDGCDTYATSADVILRYGTTASGLVGYSTTAGRFGGGAFLCSSNSGAISYGYLGPATVPHTTGAIIAGGAHKTSPSSGAAYGCLCLSNTLGTGASNSQELVLWYDNGLFKLYRGGGTSTLLATGTVWYPPGIYQHIEMRATIADSGGTCEVRIGGATVINYTGDTRASTGGTAGVDRVGFSADGTTASSSACWDDVYVLDTSGSVANTWLGDCRINTLVPTSDSSVQFTRSTGASNYLCVDEGRYNSDTDYVESATVGHIDKYGYQDLAAGVTTVHGLQAICWARKTDANTRTMRQNIYSNASTSAQTAFTLSTSYVPYCHIATLNPDGSVQWTPTTVNAALAGIEVVS